MSRIRLVLALSILALATPARAADEEPTLLGRKLSEFLKILREGEQPVQREAALKALEIIGPNHPGVLPAVFKALKEDKDETVRARAAITLGNMAVKTKEPKDVLEPLVDAAQNDKGGKVRQEAVAALGNMAAEKDLKTMLPTLVRMGLPALTKGLKDMHEGTREAAAKALGQVGPDAKEALPGLVEVLKDKKTGALTREHAARSLLRVGGTDEAAAVVPPLAEVLADSSTRPELRKLAADGLGRLGPAASAAVPALAQALADKSPEVRRAAALALEKVGPDAKDTLPAVEKLLKDSDQFVRSQALHTLGSFGRDASASIPAVLASLKDPVIEVRLSAVASLAQLGTKDDKNVLDALMAIAQEGQPAVRAAAKEALKKLQGEP